MNERGIQRYNARTANVVAYSGELQAVSSFLLPGDRTISFIISGGTASQRYEPLLPVFMMNVGVNPVLVLHDHDTAMEALVQHVWKDKCLASGQRILMCAVNESTPRFEPFFGMSPILAIRCLRRVAEKLPYTVSPGFERTAMAHLDILENMNVPISLTGLYYLAGIRDMGRFHDMVMRLPCGQAEAQRIWAELGVDEAGGREQFELFRHVVTNFAAEAMQSGWQAETRPGGANFMVALQRCGTMLIDVNDMNADLLMTYLAEELRLSGKRHFVLILDGVHITEEIAGLLRDTDATFGIISENAVDAVKGGDDGFAALAERAKCIVLFKHKTGPTAQKLAELFGKYERIVRTQSMGSDRAAFHLFNRGHHEGEQYAPEESYRVRPEEILGLGPRQAIIFDAENDRIIHYN